MDLLRDLRAFVRTVETGSFAAVARETHESHSAVTRQIAQLEAHFGVRLFHRTTHGMSLTDDGRELLGHARQMLELEEAMEGSLRYQSVSPKGTVRLATSIAFSIFLVPRIPLLMERYPELSLELVTVDPPFPDLIEARLDLAVRVGPNADSSLVARHLYEGRRITSAAPSYLGRWGIPAVPGDLRKHNCLMHEFDAGTWRFKGPDGTIEVAVSSRFCANSSEVLHGLTLSGQGITLLPELRVIDDIRAGRLRRLLAEYQVPPVPVFVVYPSRRHLPPRTRVVIDFLVEQVGDLSSVELA
jgi:DNA-binding transcriptional LysR family regulator